MNGTTKRKLTIAAGRILNPSSDAVDNSRKFAALTKIEGPAEECKRILELDGGITGAKSVVKYEKRESNRKLRKNCYWVREVMMRSYPL